jgi:hypothetical protein
MLLNEFLKEHKKIEEQNRKIQEQEATITQVKTDFGATVAQLTVSRRAGVPNPEGERAARRSESVQWRT